MTGAACWRRRSCSRAEGTRCYGPSGAKVAAQLERAGVPLAIIPVAFPGTIRPHAGAAQQQMRVEEVCAAEMRSMLDVWLDELQVEQACDAHLELLSLAAGCYHC